MAPLFWLAAGLQIGGWAFQGSTRDIDHGITVEVEARVASHVTARVIFDAGGVAHGQDECTYESEATEVAVLGGARVDLWSLLEPRRVRPYASITLGALDVSVQPKCTPAYGYDVFAVQLAAGADLALSRHFGLRGEARLLLGAEPPCCASPNDRALMFALLGTVSF